MAVSIYQVPRFNNTRQERVVHLFTLHHNILKRSVPVETPGRRMDLVCFSTENRGLVEKYGHGAWFLHRMGPFRGETKVETQLLHEKNQFGGNHEGKPPLLHEKGRPDGNFSKEGAGMRE